MTTYEAELKELKASIDNVGPTLTEFKKAIGDRTSKIEDALAELQIKCTPGAGAEAKNAVSPEIKDMIETIRGTKAATVSEPTTGGYLAVPEFQARVLEIIEEKAPLMAQTDVVNVNGNLAVFPVETGQPEISWLGETETVPAGGANLAQANIPVNQAGIKIPISNVLIQDSNLVNIESYLVRKAGDAFAKGITKAIIGGSGHNSPQGVLNKAGIGSVQSGVSGGIKADAVYDAMAELNAAAASNAKWVMNWGTFINIAKSDKKDLNLATMPISEDIPARILGREVIFCPEMQDCDTDGNVCAILADWKDAYVTVQSGGMTYLRDPYSEAGKSTTNLHFWQRVGGQCVRPEAVVKITVGAS